MSVILIYCFTKRNIVLPKRQRQTNKQTNKQTHTQIGTSETIRNIIFFLKKMQYWFNLYSSSIAPYSHPYFQHTSTGPPSSCMHNEQYSQRNKIKINKILSGYILTHPRILTPVTVLVDFTGTYIDMRVGASVGLLIVDVKKSVNTHFSCSSQCHRIVMPLVSLK
jgi:hypothetical protein